MIYDIGNNVSQDLQNWCYCLYWHQTSCDITL